MAKLTRLGSGSSSALLTRILERSELVAAVGKLSTPVLGQLIEHVGLEDAGELVTAASTPQLIRLWDRDLWTREEGAPEERFDPARFGTWLAVMLEAGEAQTAQRLRALPFDLLTLAVHRLVRVLDRTTWSLREEHGLDDDDDGAQFTPWHELVLIARDEQAWDAVLTALFALDEEDHALLRRVLERCCDLEGEFDEWDEDGGEQRAEDAVLERDVAAERDARQGASGWVSASDARAFLELARSERGVRAEVLAGDAVSRAYFREVAAESETDTDTESDSDTDTESDSDTDTESDSDTDSGFRSRAVVRAASDEPALGSLLGLLVESGVLEGAERAPIAALPAGTAVGDDDAARAEAAENTRTLLQTALDALVDEAPVLWSQRMEELGFLANVVLSGCGDGGRAFTPRDALEAATAICNLGLELQLPVRARERLPIAHDLLRRVPADRLFRAGYAHVQHELVRVAWTLVGARVRRYGDAKLRERFAIVERGQDGGALFAELDAQQLRMRANRLEALCGLTASIPRLEGSLADPNARFVTTLVQLRTAKRLLSTAQRTKPPK